MFFSRINFYLFFQICKYFALILFIFLSVAWLLQITRLFTITNFMHIEVIEIIFLSFYLIPNIVNVIVPFILIFCLLLCFTRLNKDNELIAILYLGFGLKPFKNTLIFFTIFLLFFFSLLNFYLSPVIYEKYKIQEKELRNTIDFNNMTFSNFLNLNKNTILDFKKKNNQYIDIFISFKDEKYNIVYAKKGNIYNEKNFYKFQLSNGYKISVDEFNQVEKLEFLNYVLSIENKNINTDIISDRNTYTIFDDLDSYNYLNLSFKILDLFLIICIIILFYVNNLKKIKFNTTNNIFFSLLTISILIFNQILKNSEIILFNYTITLMSLIFFAFLIIILKIRYEKN